MTRMHDRICLASKLLTHRFNLPQTETRRQLIKLKHSLRAVLLRPTVSSHS